MPYAQKVGFYKQFVSRGSLIVKKADFLKRSGNFFTRILLGAKMVAKKKTARRLPLDIFLLNIVAAVAVYQLASEIDRVKTKRRSGFCRQRMKIPRIYKKNVALADLKTAVVYMSGAFPLRNPEQLKFLVPVRADTFGARYVRGVFSIR